MGDKGAAAAVQASKTGRLAIAAISPPWQEEEQPKALAKSIAHTQADQGACSSLAL